MSSSIHLTVTDVHMDHDLRDQLGNLLTDMVSPIIYEACPGLADSTPLMLCDADETGYGTFVCSINYVHHAIGSFGRGIKFVDILKMFPAVQEQIRSTVVGTSSPFLKWLRVEVLAADVEPSIEIKRHEDPGHVGLIIEITAKLVVRITDTWTNV